MVWGNTNKTIPYILIWNNICLFSQTRCVYKRDSFICFIGLSYKNKACIHSVISKTLTTSATMALQAREKDYEHHTSVYVVLYIRMMTSSNRYIFRVTGHLCAEFTSHRWIPRTKASDAEHWCFLWSTPICLNKRLSKHSWGWWFQTPSSPLWHHCNVQIYEIKRTQRFTKLSR